MIMIRRFRRKIKIRKSLKTRKILKREEDVDYFVYVEKIDK